MKYRARIHGVVVRCRVSPTIALRHLHKWPIGITSAFFVAFF